MEFLKIFYSEESKLKARISDLENYFVQLLNSPRFEGTSLVK